MSSNGSMARVRIALDAMGGDFGPPATVPGALAALEANPELDISLVGDADAVNCGTVQAPCRDAGTGDYRRAVGRKD